MKTTLVSSTLSSNPFIRMYPFGRILSEKYETKITGPVNSNGIYEPLRNEEWNIKPVKELKIFPFYLKTFYDICKKVDSDIVHVFKPKVYSYGAGLWLKLLKNKKIILDIDDWESQYVYDNYFSLNPADIMKFFLVDFYYPESYFSKKILEKLRNYSDRIIVDALCLQKKFGGTYIPSGADTDLFDPEKYNGKRIREKFGVEKDEILVSFIGTPRKHKGILELLWAFKEARKENHKIKLMIIGASSDNKFANELRKKEGIIVENYRPHNEIPEYVAAADIIATPLKSNPSAMMQMPYKIYEMMSMAKPIIATNVADISIALKNCGTVIEPNNLEQLKKGILEYSENIKLRNLHGKRAREKCIKEYSFDVIRKRIFEVYDNLS
ncbi:MAG: glycosyltransferase family 4 protein [Nanoarchaeota archaeon]